jgi:Rad3-related DNA helicase
VFNNRKRGSKQQFKFKDNNLDENSIFGKKTLTRVLSFWCFNAGIGFREIQRLQPRSIILTSGTLSPLSSFQSELQVNF